MSIFLFSRSGTHHNLHSFPTRRSSDLIFTSSEKPEDVRSATQNGANGYIVKPTKFEDLKNLTRTIYSEWLEKGKKGRSEEHTSELQSLAYLVCRLLLEKIKKKNKQNDN